MCLLKQTKFFDVARHLHCYYSVARYSVTGTSVVSWALAVLLSSTDTGNAESSFGVRFGWVAIRIKVD